MPSHLTPKYRTGSLALPALVLLLAACGGGGSGGDTPPGTNPPPAANQPPIANAGGDKAVYEGTVFTLEGSGSDPDGGSVTYNWNVPEGFTATGQNTATLQVTTTPDIDEDIEYEFMLTVTDAQVASVTASDTAKVTLRYVDLVPDAFDLGSKENVAPVLFHASEPQTIAGMTPEFASPVSIAGENCEYSIDEEDYTAETSDIRNGQSVRVRGKVESFDGSHSCLLTIGGVEGTFTLASGASTFEMDINRGRIDFAWNLLDGISRYELTRHNSKTGESTFVADDISPDADTFTLPIGAHLQDWVNDRFLLSACNAHGCATLPDHAGGLIQTDSIDSITYVKASNPDENDQFGFALALQENILIVATPIEDSNATGINPAGQDDNSLNASGAAYVFEKDEAGLWSQVAYIKASNTGASDRFGQSVAISGNLLAIGAQGERSAARGVFEGDGFAGGTDASDNSMADAGAVYVFRREIDGSWVQEAYIKASNTDAGDRFGTSVGIDGNTLVIGASLEDSSVGGINPTSEEGDGSGEFDNSAVDSGAVYVFVRGEDGAWTQEAYIKASIPAAGDQFGRSLALHDDTLIIGAPHRQIDGAASGSAHVFRRAEGGAWSEEGVLAPSFPQDGTQFGFSVAVQGEVAAIGSWQDASAATGINGDEVADCGLAEPLNCRTQSGAVHLFRRDATNQWLKDAYLKAAITHHEAGWFGWSLGLEGEAGSEMLAVGSFGERSAARGVFTDDGLMTDGTTDANDVSSLQTGAVYLFQYKDGNWKQHRYIKSSNAGAGDRIGSSVALTTDMLAVGAVLEDSNATGINGDQTNNSLNNSGAVYIY